MSLFGRVPVCLLRLCLSSMLCSSRGRTKSRRLALDRSLVGLADRARRGGGAYGVPGAALS